MNIRIGYLQKYLRQKMTIPTVSAAGFLFLTLVTSGQYGFYGDELYYFACSKHLAWGYVDHPPLVALLTFIGTRIFGETIIGLRFLSGLAGAVTVLLSAKIAQMLGGGKLSQALAALSICFAIAFPAISSFFSMNPVDIMLCTLFIYLFAKTIDAPSPQKWMRLGVLFGVGLLNKYTFLVLGLSLLLSLVITRRWNVLKSFWMYAGVAIGLALFLPHVMWQVDHGWPTLEFMRNAAEYKNLVFVASCIPVADYDRFESIHAPAVAGRIAVPSFQQGNKRTQVSRLDGGYLSPRLYVSEFQDVLCASGFSSPAEFRRGCD